MKLTERQARLRLGQAIEAAGSQIALARTLQGVTPHAAQTMVSKSFRGPQRISAPVLALIGLRRDEAGDIHTVEPARLEVLMVQAKGDAGVRAATAIVSNILGRNQ